MKSLLQISLFFLFVTQICFTQWYQQYPLITKNTLTDVVLVDDNNGWAVGENGTIIKTTNGGIDWSTQVSGTTYSLQGVDFADVKNGWAVGDSGIVIRTTNGGLDWVCQTSGTILAFSDVDFVNVNFGTAVGSDGTIIRTTNGGTTWTSHSSGTTYSLYGVSFTDVNKGWVVGQTGIILRTTNGGVSWSIQINGISTYSCAYSVCFTDSMNGTVAGRRLILNFPEGLILKTTNGGITWTQQLVSLCRNLFGVCFTDINNGWTMGEGIILNTTNGGTIWNQQISGTSQGTYAVSFSNSSKGIVVGGNGAILNTTDGGNVWISPPTGNTSHLFGVCFADANIGTVVGEFGTILFTANGGQEWITQTSGTLFNLNDVDFTDTNNGWIVGGNGTILRTSDGGLNWIEQISGITTNLLSVYFTDQNFGWAVGQGDTILKTTNGGTSWTPHSLNNQSDFSDVYFIDKNNGWINQNSNSFKTTDGGENWTLSVAANDCESYNSVYFIDANNGHIVGPAGSKDICPPWGGNILNTSDGGSSWTYRYLEDSVLVDVYFKDILNGWAVGYLHFGGMGLILKTTDAGVTWNAQTGELTSPLNGVSFTDANNGWAVGYNGTILHTTNGGVVPVELNSFTAAANNKEVIINWSTATELNNQGFEVQRKFDTNDFTTIGSVIGHGTTTTPNEYTYVDKLTAAGKYFYRLKQIDFDGKYEYSQTVEVDVRMLNNYSLQQNYPNPFNPTTTIGFGIPEKGSVRLSVLNILGEEIRVLLNEEKEAGYQSIDFNASDLPSGVYFYRIQAGNFISTRKMILLK